MTRPLVPPMRYDGQLRIWWYTKWFDPAADLCCRCRALIPEDEVPLSLFRTVGGETWQTRIHWSPCAEQMLAAGLLVPKVPKRT